MSWQDLQRVPKPESEETSDFLEWWISAIERLDRNLFIRPAKRTVGEICSHWRQDRNGGSFTFAKCDETDISVFIHELDFLESLDYGGFKTGDAVSFELQERGGKFTGRRIARSNYKEEVQVRNFDTNAIRELVADIRSSLYVPFIYIWRDGRSITDNKCPESFSSGVRSRIEYLTNLLRQASIPQPIKDELLFLLACLHKDSTDDCVQWITDQVENGKISDPQSIGFSLGDTSEGWQQYILSILASKPNTSTIRIFAYAIWRNQSFIESFSILELKAILNVLSQSLNYICVDKLKTKRSWIRDTAEQLELLLGLLRTRNSKNSKIKMLLQPHQQITKELAKQIERVTEIVAKSDVDLFSRVQLNIQKPKGDLTPDLLYALRLYLTGDDGANAIHITSISDND
jgi:hypothetical protein